MDNLAFGSWCLVLAIRLIVEYCKEKVTLWSMASGFILPGLLMFMALTGITLGVKEIILAP